MSISYRVSLIMLLGILLTTEATAQKEPLSPELKAVDELVQWQKESFDAPGIAVGIIKNGEVYYASAHGVQGVVTQTPLTTKSLFHMASVSKPFVATAIVQLMEQGKLKLEDKLTDHLPYFIMADKRYKKITLAHMLNHSSGIPNVEDYEWDKPQYDEGAAERYSRSFTEAKLDFRPGKRFSYSNAAFDILCDVIAKASGMTFEDYTQQYIFEPVGMVNSTFYKPDVPEALATQPHVLGEDLSRVVSEVYPYNRRHAGSSTLHSNVVDMMLWAKVNLNKGSINGKRIYQESSYDLLTTAQVQINDKRSVGLSWFLGSMKDSRLIYHTGEDLGYSSAFAFLPETKSALVAMVNIDGYKHNAAGIIMANALFGDSLALKVPVHYKLKDYIFEEGMEKVKEVYYEERNREPQRYLTDPKYFDDLGYLLMDRGNPEKALECFQFLVELEPEYAGWYDSVGDAYVALDKTDLAITWYKKALEIKPKQQFTIDKLEKLLKK